MGISERVKFALYASGADVREIGKSALGEGILAAHRGSYSGKQIIITAAIHARECYTALVVLRQVRDYAGGGGAYFVPLVNPDGAGFFESGAGADRSEFLKAHLGERRMWKANAAGVDINCNFDANWGGGVQNRRVKGAASYIGEYPLCAPESAALAAFTLEVKPAFTLSYHSLGGELYWEFGQTGVRRAADKAIAARIARRIGVRRVDGDLGSAGGYKDWCVQKLHIPAVTVELVAHGTHPLRERDYANDIQKNAELPRFILDILG